MNTTARRAPRKRRNTVHVITSLAAAALAVVLVTSCMPASAPWTSDVPSGLLEAATLDHSGTRLSVSGWAGDRNTGRPIPVVLFINGELHSGAITANRPRPDVKAATGRGAHSGFAATVTVKRANSLSVCVSAMNIGPGDHALLGCKSVKRGRAPTTTTTAAPIATTSTTVPPADCEADAAPGVDWHDCDKSLRVLTDIDLSGANLSGTTFRGSNFSGATLTGATLTGANLAGATLTGATLTGVDLTGADLGSADLSNADLSGADLTDTDLTNANLIEADLTLATTTGAIITSVRWLHTICPDGEDSGYGASCVGHGF